MLSMKQAAIKWIVAVNLVLWPIIVTHLIFNTIISS